MAALAVFSPRVRLLDAVSRARSRGWQWCARIALGAAILTVPLVGHGQQGQGPETGGPRQLWPQRPGPFRILDPPSSPARVAQQPPKEEPRFVANEVLVQFLPDANDDARSAARTAVGAVGRRVLGGAARRLERLTTTLAVPDAVAILQQLPQVAFAEPNWIVRHYATSDDPYYSEGFLWGMYGDGTDPSNPFGSQAGELWEKGFTGSNDVYVAVLDEGIDINHPDLAANIWTNPFDLPDGVDNDGNGKVDDVHGWDFLNGDSSVYDAAPGDRATDSHGTHLAGTIGAAGGNGTGVVGMNWNVKIISTKFLGPDGGAISDAVEAVDYITTLKMSHGLNIVAINNSWGGGAYSQALHEAIIRAAKADILFIAAAGNISSDNDAFEDYPGNYSTLVGTGNESAARYESVISVASINIGGALSSFSNFGATTVDIAAPGEGIYSTLPQGGYGSLSGTSMAAPHVTGAAALFKSINPRAAASQIRDAILNGGIATPSLAGKTVTGKRLNVGDFAPLPDLSINDVSLYEGNSGTRSATFTVSLSARSATPVRVDYTLAGQTATAAASVFANAAAIAVPSGGSATPYPAQINVPAGLGAITRVKATLAGLSHAWPTDLDVLLVGPAGQAVMLMSDVPYVAPAENVTLTFDDSADALPGNVALSSGTYRPTNFDDRSDDTFPASAPAGPYASSLSVFTGTDPAGTWRLFVRDDLNGYSGTISGGWSLELSTGGGPDFVASAGTLLIPPGSMTQPIAVAIVGDSLIEPAETFTVVLSNPSGVTILDGEGVGTILNDDFTDASLTGLPIKAVHIIELRAAINEARARRGLPPFSFTDPSLTPQGTVIKAVHILQLREALDAVYAAAGRTPPAYTDSVIVPGVTTVKSAHILELRAALVALQ